MRILLFAKYDQAGASSRYRTLQYIPYLNSQGIQVTVNSLLCSKYITKMFARQKSSLIYYLQQYLKRLWCLLRIKHKYDVVWIEGELFPYLPFFLEKLLLPKSYVAEYDDAIYHNYNMHKKRWVRQLLGKKIANIMRKATHIIVGNEYVKEYASFVGAKQITILPTVVDADVYKPIPHGSNTSSIIIGWLGSPTTVKYLHVIEPVLQSIAKKVSVKLHVIGGDYKLEGIETFCHHWPDQWSQAEEIQLLNQIDIGIMPLIDSPWEKGKCGFKLIKYMACSKPMIASPVSANLDIVVHGNNGYLADTLLEWENYLLKLIQDPNQCKIFGEEGRKKMVNQYSLQATAPVLTKLLLNAGRMRVN